jgi:hypothetical protein
MYLCVRNPGVAVAETYLIETFSGFLFYLTKIHSPRFILQYVELYLHFPTTLHRVMLSAIKGQLYFCVTDSHLFL